MVGSRGRDGLDAFFRLVRVFFAFVTGNSGAISFATSTWRHVVNATGAVTESLDCVATACDDCGSTAVAFRFLRLSLFFILLFCRVVFPLPLPTANCRDDRTSEYESLALTCSWKLF